MQMTPQSARVGAKFRVWLRAVHPSDLPAFGVILAATFIGVWVQPNNDTRMAVWALGLGACVYILLTRFLLRSPYAARLMPVRVVIGLALATAGFYLLHSAAREFSIAYLVLIIIYATRFGVKLGLIIAAASAVAVTGVYVVKAGYLPVAEIPALVLTASAFLFAGVACGMVTTELRKRTMEVERLNEELRQRSNDLELLATTDALTGLANRRHFGEVLAREFRRAARYSRPLSLMIMDIDKLKQVNDTYGHPCGDVVIMGVSELLRRGLRAGDIAGRQGGDEFVALLPEADRESAAVVAERMRLQIAEHVFDYLGHPVRTGVCFGVACLPGPGIRTAEDLLRVADQDLYEAKRKDKRIRPRDSQLDKAL